jgi:UDP-N-acetylmuramoylalanine--D-glutamate ligase
MNAAKKKKTARKNLVYGLGATGLSIARYLRRNDINAIFYDSREDAPGLDELRLLDPDAEVIPGDASRGLLSKVERVIVSPGIPDDDVLLAKARKKKIKIVSDIELFLDELSAPLAVVTGSNGKSTVATLLSLMCDAAGVRALAGANLGNPALDLLAEETPDTYILELSSFQLHRLPELPADVAGMLNVSPDHLDWHASEEEYRAAKYRIFHEARAAVFNRADNEAPEHIPENVPQLSFGLDEPGDGQYGIREEAGVTFLARGEQLLLSVDDIALVGRHNWANALAALAMGQLMGIELPPMLQVLNEFPGLPHRMQFIDTIGGTRFINDSKATNVAAAIASIESVDGFVVLIAGGEGKGGDFDLLARSVHMRLRSAVLIGEDGPIIGEALNGLAPVHAASSMLDAVSCAAGLAESGDTVLLAPACASFDQYPNFRERGKAFCQAVEALRS